jgi:hypothetical protein
MICDVLVSLIVGTCVPYAEKPPEPVPVAEWCARSAGFIRSPYFDRDQKAALAKAMRNYDCLQAPPRVKRRAFLHP